MNAFNKVVSDILKVPTITSMFVYFCLFDYLLIVLMVPINSYGHVLNTLSFLPDLNPTLGY